MSSHPRFDPYYEWLGIEPHEQPADFYRLLGLARFETDARRIEQVADERMALVRSLQMGPRGAYTQKLLNELAAARVCLLKPRSKANYDAELARRLADLQTQQRVMATTEPLAPPVFSMHPPADHLPKIRLARRRPIALALAALLAVLFMVGGWVLSRWFRDARAIALTRKNQRANQRVLPSQTPPREPVRGRVVIKTTGNGELLFAPQTAALSGDVEVEMISGSEALTHWASPDDEAGWRFRVQQPGFFQAELTYATSTDNDAELELRIDGRIKVCSLRTSGGLDQFVSDTYTVAVPQSGEHSFAIRPRARASGKWLVLRSVRFIPVGANVIP